MEGRNSDIMNSMDRGRRRHEDGAHYTVNYRTGLITVYFVECGGVMYDVTRIDTFEGYKQDITLYCKRK